MARIHIYECTTPEDGSVIVVHKSHGEVARTNTSICETSKEAMLMYLQLCERDNPNEISFRPPANSGAIIKDSTHPRILNHQGIDLFKSLLSPVFVD